MSRCLELNYITFVHRFLFISCSALLCVLADSETTRTSCSTSVLVHNVLSQVHSFRTSAAFQLILLLDCWCLLRAPCCRIPRTANTQIQELQIPSIVTFQTSHTACLHCTCWRQQQKFVGAVKLADKNSSHPPDVGLKKRKVGEPDVNPGGSSSSTTDTPRGENLSKDPVRMRVHWRVVLRRSTTFFVTRQLSTSAEIALH